MYELLIAGPGKNALGSELMTSLHERLQEADGQPLLLKGEGDSFSAGLNLKELAGLGPDGMEGFLRKLGRLTTALFDYPGPTVACVNGHAIAGGCVLALCCDLRVGSDNPRIRIGLNEVALGLRFPPQILRVLRHQLPRTDPLILHAALYEPQAALRVGLLDELADDAESVARERLEALAGHPAAGYAAAKLDLRGGITAVDADEERRFKEQVLPMWTSDELKQRIAAALTKKKK